MILNINDNDILTKVQKYELDRNEIGRILIDVHECIAGEGKGKFFAVPNMLLGKTKREYIGKGSTEIEALQACLNLIINVWGRIFHCDKSVTIKDPTPSHWQH